MKISACIITKNEENTIVKCLNSMKKIVDEIVVVDTGSADKTIERAKACGAEIYNFTWENDFAAAKNFAISQAKGDWIIFLDADEYLSEESTLNIRDLLVQADKHDADAVMCQRINIDVDYDNRMIDSFAMIRIFRRSQDICYQNPIHEDLVNNHRDLRVVMLTDEIKIYHTGYSTSIVQEKLQRNLKIMLDEIEKNGEEEKYYRYLCDCYHGLGDYEQTVKYAKLHIASSQTSLHSESIVYLKMLYALTQTNASIESIKKEFEATIKIFADIPDFYAQYANYLFDQKLYALAINYYQQAIKIYKGKTNTHIASSFAGHLSGVYCNLGRLFLIKNEAELAMNYFCEVLLINKFNAYAFQKFYETIAHYPEVQIIELLNSIYPKTKENILFLANNLNVNVLNKVYVYYTNILKKEFGVEEDSTLPYQLLGLKEYEKLYQYSLKNLGAISTELERITTKHMDHKSITSIIIVTYNLLNVTKLCIESIRNYTERGTYELIVVDNHSTDGTIEWLKNQTDIKCVFNEEHNGFPKSCNQGIKVANGSEILLLNNDTIVTSNWLSNLKTALYSDETIGAVGPVTNNCSNYQSVEIDYKDLDELQIFAKQYNVLDAEKWEEKIKLVGFCLLMKRSVIDQIGYLDEVFTLDGVVTSGVFEDDDYCFRMITAGCRLLLCQDTFVHNFGNVFFKGTQQSYDKLVDENALKFKTKWGFHAMYAGGCRSDIIHFIDTNKPNIKVLEVGCACGATLLKIKHLNKTAEVFGIEICPETAAIAKHFAHITAENIESTHMSYEEEMFDYIIFGDVLEHLYQPQEVLKNIKKYLKPGGYILASIPNIMHVSIVKDLLLKGNWTYQDAGILDKTHIRFFTLNEIFRMFDKVGFTDISYINLNITLSADEEEFVNKLESLNLIEDKNLLTAYQYLFKVRKPASEETGQEFDAESSLNNSDDKQKLKFILRRIENDIDEEQSLAMLVEKIVDEKYNILEIVESIECDIYKRAKVTVLISTVLYKKNMVKEALKLLLEMYKLYPQDAEIVYTFAYILMLMHDEKMALKVLSNFRGEDENIKTLLKEIGINK